MTKGNVKRLKDNVFVARLATLNISRVSCAYAWVFPISLLMCQMKKNRREIGFLSYVTTNDFLA
jgi:hypothetical protein